MNMQDQVASKYVTEMLTHRFNRSQRSSVQNLRVGKSAVGRVHMHALACECSRMTFSEPMDLIPLRHIPPRQRSKQPQQLPTNTRSVILSRRSLTAKNPDSI